MTIPKTLLRGSGKRSARAVALPAWLLRVHWRSVAAFALPFFLYCLTLAPTIYNLDSAELTTAAATDGIVRATGYPLYLILGRVWALLPIGDVGYRMNLFSAFWGAVTVLLTERILRRWRIGGWATLAAVGLLSVSTFFWALSLIAEVYTLHTALMTALILLLLRWSDEPTPRRLAQVALLLGLSFGHHAATVLLVPGIVWYVLTVAPRRALAPRSLALAVLAFALGLSVYLYLPFLQSTAPAFNYAGSYDASGTFRPVNLQSASGLWWLISGRAFAGVMLGYTATELLHETFAFGIHLWRAFFAVGIGPGILGALLLLRRNWRLGGLLLLLFFFNAAFYVDYRVVDKETMFLPTYVVWSLWLALGLQWLLHWVGASDEPGARPWGSFLLRGGIVALVLLATAATWPLVDRSDDWSSRLRGERILAQAQPNAIVFGWWETTPLIEYLQLVEGMRPDVKAINRFLISGDDLKTLIYNEVDQRPLYMDTMPPEFFSTLHARRAGVLFQLSREQPWPDNARQDYFKGR